MAQALFQREELERIESKIAAVEAMTAAEIRVAVTRSSWLGIERKARRLFAKHGLAQTAARNAVLFLIDVRSRELAIIGDEAVDEKVGQQFWDDVRDAVVGELRNGSKLSDAIALGVHLLGAKLAEIFPAEGTDTNEIANGVIFD